MRVGAFSPRKSGPTPPWLAVCPRRLADLFKKPAVSDPITTVFRENLFHHPPRRQKTAANRPKSPPTNSKFNENRDKISWHKAGFSCHKDRKNAAYPRNGLKHKKRGRRAASSFLLAAIYPLFRRRQKTKRRARRR